MCKLWSSIIEFWNKKYNLTIDTKTNGATALELNILESYVEQKFPEAFRAVYKMHNGCDEYIIYPHPSRFLSTQESLNQWNYFNQVYSNNLGEELEFNKMLHSKEVKSVRWNKYWIPFAICTRGRDFYCLDFDPTEFGVKGQIIFFSIDLGDRTFISKSFEHWINDMY